MPPQVQIRLPSGQTLGRPEATVHLNLRSWSSLRHVRRLQLGGLAQEYMEGRLQLQGSLREVMAAAANWLGLPIHRRRWPDKALARWFSLRAHTRHRDRAQIQFHYDLSDDFYALWLDPLRVYSCAYYRSDGLDLAQAQQAKLEHICRKLMLKPGERFLDIGAGWGGLLIWAAQHHGVDATGITLSKNQWAYANQEIERLGLQDRVRIRLLDYRALDTEPGYDKIASVGMFEHVGRARMGAYFAKLKSLLRPGGLLMNHGITAGATDHDQLGAGLGDFIEKYIFPGGELMHTSAVLAEMADAGLEMVDTENLRPHYARTLWAWSDALESKLQTAQAVLSRDRSAEAASRILRAYRLYLAGCAMAFEQGWISLHQMLATRPTGRADHGSLRGAQSDHPFRRDHMYPQHGQDEALKRPADGAAHATA